MDRSSCQLAEAYKTALSAAIPRSDEQIAIRFEGRLCSYLDKNGSECPVEDLMLFPVEPICMGYANSCSLRREDAKAFKRVAEGSKRERAGRFLRDTLATRRQLGKNNL